MCDVPSIAVFCSESIEWFPGTASRFFLKLLDTIPVAPIITGTIVHFRFHIRCISIHKHLYLNLLLLLLLLLSSTSTLSSSSSFVITLMQGIYNYVPDTNHGSRVNTVLQLFCIHSLCYMH